MRERKREGEREKEGEREGERERERDGCWSSQYMLVYFNNCVNVNSLHTCTLYL